ncbi:MAG: hypothetical protein R3Y63_15195 [Eubacteriales bacterium]
MKHLDQLTLSLLVDDMLPKKQAEECHKHIASCPFCEQAFDDLQAISFAMAKLPEVEPVEGFASMKAGILGNLPEQDAVSSEKVIAIEEHHVKQSVWANIDWKQGLSWVAIFALAGTFLFSPPQDNFDTAMSESSGSAADASGDLTIEARVGEEDMVAASYPDSAGTFSSPMGEEDVLAEFSFEGDNEAESSGLYETLYQSVQSNPYVFLDTEMDEGTLEKVLLYAMETEGFPPFVFALKSLPEDLISHEHLNQWEDGTWCYVVTAENVPDCLGEVEEIFLAYPEIEVVEFVVTGLLSDYLDSPHLSSSFSGVVEGVPYENPYVVSWADMDEETMAFMNEQRLLSSQFPNFIYLLNEIPASLVDASFWDVSTGEGEPCFYLLKPAFIPEELPEFQAIFDAFPTLTFVQLVYLDQGESS